MLQLPTALLRVGKNAAIFNEPYFQLWTLKIQFKVLKTTKVSFPVIKIWPFIQYILMMQPIAILFKSN